MTRFSAEERRRSILEATARVFSRKGFFGATTRELAEECGVSEAILYRHFSSKEELYEACLEQLLCFDCQEKMLGEFDASDRDLRRLLRSFCDLVRSWAEARPDVLRLMSYARLQPSLPQSGINCVDRMPFCRFLKEVLKERRKETPLKPSEVGSAARLFMTILTDRCLAGRSGNGPVRRAPELEFLVRIIAPRTGHKTGV